jgi:acyl carrier protein
MSTLTLDRQHVEQETISLVKDLLAELGSHEAAARVTLDSSFDRDLGLGSLERVELLIRTERRLGVRVPEALAQRADTPAEWVRSLLEGEQPSGSERPAIRQPGEAAPPPIEAVSFSQVLRSQAERDPGRVQVHLLEEGQLDEITYGRLLTAAEALENLDIRVSMDGKGRWLDNVFIERLWRSVKYELTYLKEYATGSQLYKDLKMYFEYYNKKRPHQSFSFRTPSQVYQPLSLVI